MDSSIFWPASKQAFCVATVCFCVDITDIRAFWSSLSSLSAMKYELGAFCNFLPKILTENARKGESIRGSISGASWRSQSACMNLKTSCLCKWRSLYNAITLVWLNAAADDSADIGFDWITSAGALTLNWNDERTFLSLCFGPINRKVVQSEAQVNSSGRVVKVREIIQLKFIIACRTTQIQVDLTWLWISEQIVLW